MRRHLAAHRARRARARPQGRGLLDIERFDIAIDGADQISTNGWLVKGGGDAYTREKIVAAAAERFVVIADSTKLVDALHGSISLELLPYGLRATMRRIAPVSLRTPRAAQTAA
jgi:ribose 5-phosphate isomerase A